MLEQRGLRARVAVEALPIPPELHVRIVRVRSCILIDAPVVEPLEEVRARPLLPVDLREVVGVVRFEPHVPLRLEQRPLLPQEGRLAPQHARRRVGHAHIERGPAEFDVPRRSDDVDELLLVLPRFRRAQVELDEPLLERMHGSLFRISVVRLEELEDGPDLQLHEIVAAHVVAGPLEADLRALLVRRRERHNARQPVQVVVAHLHDVARRVREGLPEAFVARARRRSRVVEHRHPRVLDGDLFGHARRVVIILLFGCVGERGRHVVLEVPAGLSHVARRPVRVGKLGNFLRRPVRAGELGNPFHRPVGELVKIFLEFAAAARHALRGLFRRFVYRVERFVPQHRDLLLRLVLDDRVVVLARNRPRRASER